MVAFCVKCGASLPKRDITIADGREYTSPDYTCPTCKEPASEVAEEKDPSDLIQGGDEFRIAGGKVEKVEGQA
jgi:hypothetical protein